MTYGGPQRHYSDYYRPECRALEHVIRIMVGYWLVTHLIGFTIFYLYFMIGAVRLWTTVSMTNISGRIPSTSI